MTVNSLSVQSLMSITDVFHLWVVSLRTMDYGLDSPTELEELIIDTHCWPLSGAKIHKNITCKEENDNLLE